MVRMTVSEFLSKLAHRLWSTNEILLLVRPAGKALDESLHKPCPGEFRPVTEVNIGDCAAFEDASHYVPIYRQMLAQGDSVHYAYLNDKCSYRCCMQRSGDITNEGCLVHTLKANEIYIHYGFCAPDARGNGLHAEGLHQFVLDNPNNTAYILVKADNYSSLRGSYRNGYEIHSRITIKCRLLRRRLIETALTTEEGNALWPK